MGAAQRSVNRIGAIAVPRQEISIRNKGLRFFPGPVQLRFGETVNGSTGQCATSCAALAGCGAARLRSGSMGGRQPCPQGYAQRLRNKLRSTQSQAANQNTPRPEGPRGVFLRLPTLT